MPLLVNRILIIDKSSEPAGQIQVFICLIDSLLMNLCLLLNLCLCVCKGLCFRFLGAWWRWAIVSSTISVTCNCAFPFCIFCVCFSVFVSLFVFVFTLYLIECARVLCHIGGDNPGARHLLLQMFVLPLSI